MAGEGARRQAADQDAQRPCAGPDLEKEGERRSSGGIVIPATAQVAKRLIWATVVAQGQNVRACEVGDKVLFSPDDRYEVEVQGEDYVMLRERELHAVAAQRIEASTGLYLSDPRADTGERSTVSWPACRPRGTTIVATPEQIDSVTFNDQGLVAAIAQDVDNGDVLMMAWMNRESLAMTLHEGRMVYWSRSRQELWRKGDTSGDRQFVREAYFDCDGDALLFKVEQEGVGACHTGNRTCFFRAFG